MPFWRLYTDSGRLRRHLEAAMPAPGTPLVVHAFHNTAVKQAAWWGLFWKKRAVTVAHRGVIYWPRNPLPYWSPGIDAFLVNSTACVRILRRLGVSPRRLFHVPNAVPDSRLVPGVPPAALRASLGIPGEAPVFFCIGGNSPNKGVRELIGAFALAFPETRPAPLPRPHLVVIGISPGRWQDPGCEPGLARRIHCPGRSEDVGSYLAASSVFVLPSFSESMPNTLLEAMRAGLPCIGTAVGAVPEILAGCGLVVPPGDPPALARDMDRLLTDENLRAGLASATRAQAREYVPEKRLDRVEGIYTTLLRSRGYSL
jgi:glycosyltransferase involved in cell wall biosynthesis